MKADQTPTTWKRLRAACKGVRAAIDEAIHAHLERYVERLEAIYEDRHMREPYKRLKTSVGLAGRSSRGQQFVLNESGVLLRKKADILQRWARFFSTLLNTKAPKFNPAIDQKVTQRPASTGSHRLSSAPTMDETKQAVCTLHNWKAPGGDAIMAELLKIGDQEEPVVLERFHAILENVWKEEEASQTWKDSSSRCSTRRRIDLTATTTGGSRFFSRRQGPAEDRYHPPQRILRNPQHPTGRAVRVPTWTIHGLHAIRRAPASRAGATTEDTTVHVIRRCPEGLRLGRPGATVEGAISSRGIGEDDRSHPSIPRRDASSSAHGRREALGVVSGYAGPAARMRAVSAAVQHFSSRRLSRSLSRGSARTRSSSRTWCTSKKRLQLRRRRHRLNACGGQYGGCYLPMTPVWCRGLRKDWRG